MEFFPLVWAIIIGFCIALYVILDGFTLGTAMLLPFLTPNERDLAVSVILPTWDGNQTWLVLGAACLYGAFPAAFSILLPVMYLPILVMVLALLFRGVVFEFRLKDHAHIKYWDRIFTAASMAVTLVQGIVLATFVAGFDYGTELVSKSAFVTLFALFVSVSLMIGYCLLGSTRLIYKTEGALQAKMYKIALIAGFMVVGAVGVVSLWTPYINPSIFARWFKNDNWMLIGILPYLSGLSFLVFLYALRRREEHLPFYCAVSLFMYSYVGYLICLYPYIVPYKITFWEAAAPTSSLRFMIVGAVVMLPILLLYTAYSYNVFKGKVKNVFHY
ncbi:MAG: cytochrome d ubiquinol oxidase subunit II [Pseudomonadota bacterium]|nr:cytochrome d ubiquinol oxidase subunit II [Pseudomonadota bacterium]